MESGFLLAPVIGAGTDEDPFRPTVADREGEDGDRLEIEVREDGLAIVTYEVADPSDLLEAEEVEHLPGEPEFDDSPPPEVGSFVVDPFTDTSGTNLNAHTGETGATWTRHASYGQALFISNANRMRGEETANQTMYYASGVPASASYTVAADLYRRSSVAAMGICGRVATATDDAYMARWNTSGTAWELYKIAASAATLLGSFTNTPTVDTLVPFSLEITDATKKVFVSGVERISSADNAITAAGRAGIRGRGGTDSAGIHLDNFTATDPAVPALALPMVI